MQRTRAMVLVIVCLSFTGPALVRAEEPHSTKLVGGAVQMGSAVGFAQYRGDATTAIGGSVAALIRVAIATVGAEYEYLAVGEAPTRGELQRVGLTASLDLLRINRHFGGPNAALILWIDGSLGREYGRWYDNRAVTRNDVAIGWGTRIEHRVSLSTRPRRLETISWKFGWRLVTAPRYGENLMNATPRCRADTSGCSTGGGNTGPLYDVGLVVSSSLSFEW